MPKKSKIKGRKVACTACFEKNYIKSSKCPVCKGKGYHINPLLPPLK